MSEYQQQVKHVRRASFAGKGAPMPWGLKTNS